MHAGEQCGVRGSGRTAREGRRVRGRRGERACACAWAGRERGARAGAASGRVRPGRGRGGEQAAVRGRGEREGKEEGKKKKNGEKKRKESGKKRKEKGKEKERGEKRERERCVGADRGERSCVADRRPSGAGWDGGEEKEGGYGRRKPDARTAEILGGKIRVLG